VLLIIDSIVFLKKSHLKNKKCYPVKTTSLKIPLTFQSLYCTWQLVEPYSRIYRTTFKEHVLQLRTRKTHFLLVLYSFMFKFLRK
jgi:hypothetical protein